MATPTPGPPTLCMLTPSDLDSPSAPSAVHPVPRTVGWRLAAACLCAVLLILLIGGSLCSPIVKRNLRPVLGRHVLPTLIRTHQHRILHILGFGLPALIFFGICRTRGSAVAGAGLMTLMVVTLEYIQHRVYRNPLEWWDIRDDLTGIVIAALVALAWRKLPVPCTGDRRR